MILDRYGLVQLTAPSHEPITLEEAKVFLRLDTEDHDFLLLSLITAAREHIEMYTRRQLVTARYQLTMDDWPRAGIFKLPRPPLIHVERVNYIDGENVVQTVDPANYSVDMSRLFGRIVPTSTYSWPALYDTINAVTVDYQAGYGTAYSVPETAKTVCLMLVADMYEHAETRLEMRLEDNQTYRRLLAGITIEELA